MDIPIKKNDELDVEIIDYGVDGEGIAKINGYTIFVMGALKNEKVKVHITKVQKDYAFAKIVEIITPSDKRKQANCETYKRCGGCNLRHIDYEETLKIKQEKVQNLVNKMLTNKIEVCNTIGMKNPIHYRNKAIYPISQDKKVGIFAQRSHEIIPISKCMIQTEISQEIAKYIVENWKDTIYDEKTKKGLLRNIMIREGFNTKEVMCVLVQNGEKTYDYKDFIKRFPQIKTIIINVNKKDTNVVLSKENIVIYGNGYITDMLGDYKFKISPNSFYQINPIQTEILYNLAIEKADLKKADIVCDLYCGIGTIGIFASKYVKKVYGIEIVEEAIKDANENLKLNNIENVEFIVGDTEKAFDKLLKNNVKPNVVFVDPPRKGLDTTTIENLCNLKLERLIYISCNPATLMRDLQKLEKIYNVNSITPVDNFCYTSHVECVTSLHLK